MLDEFISTFIGLKSLIKLLTKLRFTLSNYEFLDRDAIKDKSSISFSSRIIFNTCKSGMLDRKLKKLIFESLFELNYSYLYLKSIVKFLTPLNSSKIVICDISSIP